MFHLQYDDFPIGFLTVQLDDGYVGETYSIEFEYNNNGEFILSIDDTGLHYVLTQLNGDYQHGKIGDLGKEERDKIAELIRKTMD